MCLHLVMLFIHILYRKMSYSCTLSSLWLWRWNVNVYKFQWKKSIQNFLLKEKTRFYAIFFHDVHIAIKTNYFIVHDYDDLFVFQWKIKTKIYMKSGEVRKYKKSTKNENEEDMKIIFFPCFSWHVSRKLFVCLFFFVAVKKTTTQLKMKIFTNWRKFLRD